MVFKGIKKVFTVIMISGALSFSVGSLAQEVQGTQLRFEMQSTGIEMKGGLVSESVATRLDGGGTGEPVVAAPQLGILTVLDGSNVSVRVDGDEIDAASIQQRLIDGDASTGIRLLGSQSKSLHFSLSQPSKLSISAQASDTTFDGGFKITNSAGGDIYLDSGELSVKSGSIFSERSGTAVYEQRVHHLPAGDFILSPMGTSSNQNVDILDIAVSIPDDLLTPENKKIMITDFRLNNNNPQFGKAGAFTDGLTSEFDYRDTDFFYAGDYLDFTLLEAGVIEFYQQNNGHADQSLEIVTKSGGGFVDEQGRVENRNGILLQIHSGTPPGWYSMKFTFTAGEYRIRKHSRGTVGRGITEMRVVPQTHPSYAYVRPSNEVEVVVDAYQLKGGDRNIGRYAAFTDGVVELYGQFDSRDTSYISGNAGDYIDFTLSEIGNVQLYFGGGGSTDPIMYINRTDGGTFASGLTYIQWRPNRGGWVGFGNFEPGTYKIRSSGNIPTITEIRAIRQ